MRIEAIITKFIFLLSSSEYEYTTKFLGNTSFGQQMKIQFYKLLIHTRFSFVHRYIFSFLQGGIITNGTDHLNLEAVVGQKEKSIYLRNCIDGSRLDAPTNWVKHTANLGRVQYILIIHLSGKVNEYMYNYFFSYLCCKILKMYVQIIENFSMFVILNTTGAMKQIQIQCTTIKFDCMLFFLVMIDS